MTHLRELTGMRGAAALLVVFFHGVFFFRFSSGSWPSTTASKAMESGWIGVDFFFVLSAFLLALPLLRNEGRPAWIPYLGKRWLRIAPPYVVSIVLVLAIAGQLSYIRTNAMDVLLHLVYLHPFVADSFMSINSVFWSLGVEFQFYMVLPLFVLLSRTRAWPGVVAGCLVASIAWRAWAFNPADGGNNFWISNQLPGFLGHFAIGLAAAQAFVQSRGVPGIRPAAIAALGLAFILLPLIFLNDGPNGAPTWNPSLAANALLRPLIGVGFGALILGLAGRDGLAQRALSSAGVHKVGEFSYSLYLVHIPVGFLLLPHMGTVARFGFVAYLLVLTVATLAASWLFYAVIERPSLALKDLVFGAKRPVPSTPTSTVATPYPRVSLGTSPMPSNEA